MKPKHGIVVFANWYIMHESMTLTIVEERVHHSPCRCTPGFLAFGLVTLTPLYGAIKYIAIYSAISYTVISPSKENML